MNDDQRWKIARWIETQRDRLTTEWSREQCIAWLVWNDRNGIYTDEANEAEGWDPMTHEEAVDAVVAAIEEEPFEGGPMLSPEDLISASEEANPSRYRDGNLKRPF